VLPLTAVLPEMIGCFDIAFNNHSFNLNLNTWKWDAQSQIMHWFLVFNGLYISRLGLCQLNKLDSHPA
jgi:hypothetical protein